MRRLASLALAGTMAFAVLAGVTAPPASADIEHHKSGTCSGSSTWRLDLDKEAGRIESDFDINSTAGAGVSWRVRMSDNGTRFFNQIRVTNAFGNFEAEGNTFDRAGVVDKITAKATNLRTGEVCRGTLGI
jgi:hypothetical protein